MEDWNEWWFDIHSAKCKANVLAGVTKRIQRAKDKGCMGVDPDNVDSVSNLLLFIIPTYPLSCLARRLMASADSA